MEKEVKYPKEQGFHITGKVTDRESYQLWYDNNSHFTNQQVTPGYEFLYWLLPFVRGKVIDLGCQWGGVTKILLDCPNATVVCGIDITEKNIYEAYQYCAGHPKLGFIEKHYIEDFPTEHQKYDTVVCTGVLEHVLDPIKVLEKCIELMLPGGQILLMVPNGNSFPEPDHIREYSPETLYKDICKASDNTKIRVYTWMSTTHSPWVNIENYSWLLAVISRK